MRFSISNQTPPEPLNALSCWVEISVEIDLFDGVGFVACLDLVRVVNLASG